MRRKELKELKELKTTEGEWGMTTSLRLMILKRKLV